MAKLCPEQAGRCVIFLPQPEQKAGINVLLTLYLVLPVILATIYSVVEIGFPEKLKRGTGWSGENPHCRT
jgi:hypothetical protein